MSAVYRIDVDHAPAEGLFYATVYRLSDSEPIDVKSGRDAAEALRRAQASVAVLAAQQETQSVYVDEAGEIVPEHSVRA